jgi:hypothetical protein
MSNKENKTKKLVQKVNYAYVHKLSASVALLAFFVIMASGLMADASIISIVVKSFLVIIAVGLITRVVVSMLASYEEINSGKA